VCSVASQSQSVSRAVRILTATVSVLFATEDTEGTEGG